MLALQPRPRPGEGAAWSEDVGVFPPPRAPSARSVQELTLLGSTVVLGRRAGSGLCEEGEDPHFASPNFSAVLGVGNPLLLNPTSPGDSSGGVLVSSLF